MHHHYIKGEKKPQTSPQRQTVGPESTYFLDLKTGGKDSCSLLDHINNWSGIGFHEGRGQSRDAPHCTEIKAALYTIQIYLLGHTTAENVLSGLELSCSPA